MKQDREIPIRSDNTQYRRQTMNHDLPMGGGNIWAILISGALMFVFFLCGWSVMGTIFLILFLIVGFYSLFPIIAAFLALARLCVVHAVDGAVLGALIFWIIILLLFEFSARYLIKEESGNGDPAEERK